MNDKFLNVAKEAAIEAGKIISKYSGKISSKKIKNEDSSDFATEADLEAEKVILKIIQDNFPEHSFISEEAGERNKDSNYTWVIDPLDGTAPFSAGLPTFSVSIGLLEKNRPLLGVVYQILTQDLYYALQSEGAFLNGERIKVGGVNDLEKAFFGFDFGHRARRSQKIEKYVLPLINKIRYPISYGSDALILALVGRGVLDGFVNEDNTWDSVAGAMIIVEAGGKVTDLKGKEIDWTKKRIEFIASNGLIHEAILEALNR